MKIEFRTKDGNLIMKFFGIIANAAFKILTENDSRFEYKIEKLKKLNRSDFIDTPIFTCKEYCKFFITNEIEIWVEPNDYFKIIEN